MHRTVYRVCPFCEATCGLAIDVEGDAIVRVRGDEDDPFSRGFICPKAYGLKEIHRDPERLRRPLRRTASGWQEIGWEEAYEEIASRLLAIRERYGTDAIGMYLGNPIRDPGDGGGGDTEHFSSGRLLRAVTMSGFWRTRPAEWKLGRSRRQLDQAFGYDRDLTTKGDL